MGQSVSRDATQWRQAPRWAALLAALAIGMAYALLPDILRIGPRWLLALLIVVVVIPLTGARYRSNERLTRTFGLMLTGLVTVAIVTNAALLIARLPGGKTSPTELLGYGALIWGANILVFGLWYWEIDCGGPHARHMQPYKSDDFLFPQVQLAARGGQASAWSPTFMDYLFLAFNTSTAFSPTDTLILSRRAKALMMLQSMISLAVVAVLIARGINTLTA